MGTVIEKTHSDPIYDVEWIQSQTGTGPMDQMVLCNDSEQEQSEQSESSSNGTKKVLYGGTSLEYRTDAGATKYLVGTEQGTIISVERKAKKDGDSQKQIKLIYGESMLKDECFKHHGPIYSLSRNYFLQ